MYIPKKQYGGCELDSREAKSRAEPTEEVKPFQIDKESFQCTKLRCQMSTKVEESIAQVLTTNVDFFAWSASYVLRIDLEFHCHKQASYLSQG